ncbi:TerD family protein [Streptomyces sp. NPDC050264]|uniref:TerD family protein n=1 Tax=Streptomyces sp. NPDC050264 TaxID=3155038 RepID=UPI00342EDAA0
MKHPAYCRGHLPRRFGDRQRARTWLPVSQRLCTLALNRQVDPPTPDMKLGTLAAHYGVPQQRAHDALDHTRVLAGILRATLREAAQLALPLPLVACPPRAESQFTPKPPKTPCAYRNPGRLTPDKPLRQGMKVAITGETTHARAELIGRGVAAGLNMMTSVSRHTSVLVANEAASGSAKARRAAAEDVPVIDENTFVQLLDDVQVGASHEVSAPGPAAPAPRRPVPVAAEATDGPLAGHRVLVLGGAHGEAVNARTRIVELGGSAAVNLSRSVTAVLVLADGEDDRRMRRIAELGLPVHDEQWLTTPTASAGTAAQEKKPKATQSVTDVAAQAVQVLPRGGVTDLPSSQWHLTASWAPQEHCEVDVVAFVLDDDEQVTFDEDFVFYGAPENPAGTVQLRTDGPAEQTITVDLATLPPATHRVVVAAAIEGSKTFGDVGAVQITTAPGSDAAPLTRATLDAATTERTLLLAEFYRRGPLWRFRAVGQGYDHGLAPLARSYGVDIDG